MDEARTKRGYALTGLMCMGGLACGSGGTAQETSESSGYPMTGTGSDSGTSETGTGTMGSETETGDETETDTGDPPGCSYRGDICGEMSVCQCSCDYSADCCSCAPTTCTEDIHCPDDQVCLVWTQDHYTNSGCFDPSCANPDYVYLNGPDADPSEFADVVCAWNLRIRGTTLSDLTALANLEQVISYAYIDDNQMLTSLDGWSIKSVETLNITYNDNLTNITALTSLETVEGGMIYCNATLDPLEIDATLAQVPGGDVIYASNNGDGPCP